MLMRVQYRNQPPYAARVEKIESGAKKNVEVGVRWSYRPDSEGAAAVTLLSPRYYKQSMKNIEDTCVVHRFNHFCRFEYTATVGAFIHERVSS